MSVRKEVKVKIEIHNATINDVPDLFDQGVITEEQGLAAFDREVSAVRALAERTPAPDPARLAEGKERLLAATGAVRRKFFGKKRRL